MHIISDDKKKGANEFQAQKKMVQDFLESAKNGDEVTYLRLVSQLSQNINNRETLLCDIKDAHGRTAVHFAASEGRKKILRLMVKQTDNKCVEYKDEDGGTPLYYAVMHKQISTVELLLSHGARADVILNSNNVTALHQAAAKGSVKLVHLLLDAGASSQVKTENGTALHWAVSEGKLAVVQALMKHNVEVNVVNSHGITPLLLSVLMRKIDIATFFLQHTHARLTDAIMGGVTSVHLAAETGFVELLNLMLSSRPEETIAVLQTKTDAGSLPLELATSMDHTAVMELLHPLTEVWKDKSIDELRSSTATTHEMTQHSPQKDTESTDNTIQLPLPRDISPEEWTIALDWKTKGNAAYVIQDFQNAIQCYSQAIALQPSEHTFYSNRCAAYLGAGELDFALQDVRVARALKPEWTKGMYREAQCLERLEKYEEASFLFWDILKTTPSDKALEKRFQACVAKGRSEHLKQTEKKEEEDVATSSSCP